MSILSGVAARFFVGPNRGLRDHEVEESLFMGGGSRTIFGSRRCFRVPRPVLRRQGFSSLALIFSRFAQLESQLQAELDVPRAA